MTKKDIEKKSERVPAYEKLEQLVNRYQRVTRWFGFDIFRDDYKLNVPLFYSFFVTISYTVNCLYWSFDGAKKGDLNQAFNSISCVFTSLQVQALHSLDCKFLLINPKL